MLVLAVLLFVALLTVGSLGKLPLVTTLLSGIGVHHVIHHGHRVHLAHLAHLAHHHLHVLGIHHLHLHRIHHYFIFFTMTHHHWGHHLSGLDLVQRVESVLLHVVGDVQGLGVLEKRQNCLVVLGVDQGLD